MLQFVPSLRSQSPPLRTPHADFPHDALLLCSAKIEATYISVGVRVIKVEERVSFADAFVLALAERLDLPLLTTGHHEADHRAQRIDFRGKKRRLLFVSMCASTVDDAARGIDFLFNKNRLNVAISRAQSLAFVVGNPTFARTDMKTLEQTTQVNLFARLCELHALCPPPL